MTAEQESLALHVDRDNVGWLTLDLPGSRVNVLTVEVMSQLDRRLGDLESRIATGKLVAVVLRSGKEGSFVVGADVSAIADLRTEEEAFEKSRAGQRIFRRLERLTVPTIAAVDGVCLGGGTELVLSCGYRVASDRAATEIGLPEVRLGILPGFGGCVRLPRLVGIRNALKMILTGSSVSPEKARRLGLVDQVVSHARFDTELRSFVEDVLRGRRKPGGYQKSFQERLLEDTVPGRKVLFAMARRQTVERTGDHYPAPLRALEVVRQAYTLSVDQALEVEARGLAELAVTPVSKNLVRLFLLRQAARRVLGPELEAQRREVRRTAVLGAGVMGGGIAEVIAARDIPVVLKDVDQEALDEGLRHAHRLLKQGGEKGVFTPEEVGLKFALIQGTLTYDKFDEVDLVIEAVVERLPVKQTVLRECEARMPEEAVFATNTSSLSVAELASAAERPERVLGLHFFNPVHKMPLVEVIRTEDLSDAAMATALGFVVTLGKTPVLVDDAPGFLVNRLLAPYLNEAGFLLEEGVPVEALDRALREFGMPMGPCRLLDEVGFDVAEHVAREMEAAFGDRMRPSPVIGLLRQEGRLGRKNDRGFYIYDHGREQEVDREVRKALERRFGRHTPDDAEILRRSLYPMVNEAAHALAAGIVESADQVDLAIVMGTGFPPFRGGLLRWADHEGLPEIVRSLSEHAERHGPRFAPAPLLEETAQAGRTFTQPA